MAVTLGKVGLALVLIGIFAATFGAALETALSSGYVIAQYLGWPWGKHMRTAQGDPLPPGDPAHPRRIAGVRPERASIR